MATVNFNNVEYNVVLIDPTIANLGEGNDGLTPQTALQTFPSQLVNNTCYVVRRTSELTEALVNHQVDTTLVNVMFLGMPKSTDKKWIQDLITDDTINTAWKNDEADYANIRFWHITTSTDTSSWNRACINGANLEDVTCINCYLFRQNAQSASSDYRQYSYTSPFFTNNGSTAYKTKFRFYNCKFGVKGIDLDKDIWLDTYTSVSDVDESYQYYSKWCKGFISAYYVHTFSMENCVINHVGWNYAGDKINHGGATSPYFHTSSAFNITSVRNFDVKNIEVNSTAIYQSSYGYNQVFQIGCLNGSFRNVKMNTIVGNYQLGQLIRLSGSNLAVSDIDIYVKKFKDYSYTSTPDITYSMIYVNPSAYTGKTEITNINFFGNEENGAKLAQVRVLDVYGKAYSWGTPYSHKIDNVNVYLTDNLDESVYKNLQVNSSTNKPYCNCVYFGFSTGRSGDGNYNSNSNVYAESGRTRLNMTDYPQITNIKIDAPYTQLYCSNIVANFDELRCGLNLGTSCSLDIKKLTFDKLGQEVISNSYPGNYVRVRELECNPSLMEGIVAIKEYFNQTAIYVEKSNVHLFSNNNYNSSGDLYGYSQICCLNMVHDGRFFARNQNIFAQSWGVTREGSASSASLKLNSNYVSSDYPLRIGADPYKGFGIMPKTTGKKKLIAYFAHKNFSPDSEVNGVDQFKLIIRTPKIDKNGLISYETFYSTFGKWEDDTSVWNDVDCVAKKMVVPIEVYDTSLPVEVKLEYNWYHQTGVVYFDPDMQIEDDTDRE